LICRVLATAGASRTDGFNEQELIDFIQSTFAAHQHGQVLNAASISEALARLLGAGLIDRFDDRYRLTELGKVAGELGIQVESVVRIARALRGLVGSQMTDSVILAAAQISAELDDIPFPVHKKSIKERARWRGAIQQQRLPASVVRELGSTDDAGWTARCKRLSSVLMWIEGVELSRMEASLLLHLPGENAARPIRASAERTRDLIGVVFRIGALAASDGNSPIADIDDLATRLEIGIPADILWLAKEAKRGLERGDHLALRRNHVASAQDLRTLSDDALLQIIESNARIKRIKDSLNRAKATTERGDDDLPMPTPPAM
jgi:helicase